MSLIQVDLRTPQKNYKKSNRWTIREITSSDLEKFEKYFIKQQKNYGDLFSLGCKAFGAFSKDNGALIFIVSYADTNFYDLHYMKHQFEVGPQQVYQFAGEIAPPYRRTLVSWDVLLKSWKYWRNNSKKETICCINENNTVSLRFHFHLNFKEVGESVDIYRLFGFKWSRRETYKGEKFPQYVKKTAN